MEALQSLDVELFRLLNQGLASTWLDHLMLSTSDKLPWFIVGGVAVAIGLLRRDKSFLALCVCIALTIGLVDLVTYQVLKPAFSRQRPCYQLTDVRLVPERCGSDFGFPSNHAANSMGAATALALAARRRIAVVAVAGALGVGFSRIYLGVHFPGDVLAGFVVGGTIAWAMHHGFQRIPMLRPGKTSSSLRRA